MKAPRSVIHKLGATDGATTQEYLSVAIRITVAGGAKDGFFIQLFPDLRGPQAIYLTVAQMDHLLSRAEQGANDTELWAELSRIPLEPLQPARSLYPRLRNLLVDTMSALREEVHVQQRRAEARARAAESAEAERPAAPATPRRDPDAL